MNEDIVQVVLLALVILLSVSSQFDRTRPRLERIERKLDRIMDHFEIHEFGERQWAKVDELLREGKKIEAIKRYRQFSGASLKEAKEAVERRMG
jgi:hypothetical protein